MSQMKNYDMALAKKFCGIAQAVVSRPTSILKRVEKANDKVDFSSGRFQEIAIDIESISEDISDKNFNSMEALENMIVELLKQSMEGSSNDANECRKGTQTYKALDELCSTLEGVACFMRGMSMDASLSAQQREVLIHKVREIDEVTESFNEAY